MSFYSGRLPAFFLFMAMNAGLPVVIAQHNTPLTLAEAEDLALDSEPGVVAILARADAFTERSVAAGQLPPPSLRLGLNNFPFESGGFSTEGMTNAAVGLRQSFPPGDSRRLDTQRHAYHAEEMSHSAAARTRQVLGAVRQSWLEAWYWRRAHALILESRSFFSDIAEITRSLYAVGRRDQQDVLRAELELSRLEDRLIDAASQERQARAGLDRWIGSAARRPIAMDLPAWDQLPGRESLLQAAGTHPVLMAADAQVLAGDAGVSLAAERSKPEWSVDLNYSYRDGTLVNGDPRSDFISLNVNVGLPFFGGKQREDRELAAALDERRAAINSRERLARELNSRLEAEYARWQESSRRLELFDDRILAQSRKQAEAALAAYQSDAGDFADVMRGYIDSLNAQLDYSRLQAERAKSYAALADLGGLPR